MARDQVYSLEQVDRCDITLFEAYVFLRLMAMPGVEQELRNAVEPYLEDLNRFFEGIGWSPSEWRSDLRARPEILRVRQRFINSWIGGPLMKESFHREPVGPVQVEVFPSLEAEGLSAVGRGIHGR